MTRITCTRRLQFAAGHRVAGHESKCAHLHGHNYVALLTAEAEGGLDSVGRVVDFSVLKQRVGGWIDEQWDHGLILWDKDEAAAVMADICGWIAGPFARARLFRLPTNPTAENMAAHLLTEVGPQVLVGTGVRLTRVELWETENCRAEASL